MFRQETLTVQGYDETLCEFVPERREVEFFHDGDRIILVMGDPAVEDHDRPDLCIEWHPGTGWCVYAHGHGSDEVQAKLILNPDSVEISRP